MIALSRETCARLAALSERLLADGVDPDRVARLVAEETHAERMRLEDPWRSDEEARALIAAIAEPKSAEPMIALLPQSCASCRRPWCSTAEAVRRYRACPWCGCNRVVTGAAA